MGKKPRKKKHVKRQWLHTSCFTLQEIGMMPETGANQCHFVMQFTPPVAGQTIRADFEGGALSSDFGVLLLRGVDQQIGLTEHLAAAIHDKRHPSYIDHPLRDLLAQRM